MLRQLLRQLLRQHCTVTRFRLLVTRLLVASLPVASLAAPSTADSTPPPADDPLQRFGVHVTTGAAAGYVDDRVCQRCHGEIARSYSDVAMARSFYRPGADTAVEDFGVPFEHPVSQRIYEMHLDGDRYTFRRYQRDHRGDPINVFEVDVDWILGSGNHSRVYLYRTSYGELYQLPLAWYADDGRKDGARWGMAPGFDQPRHQGVRRIVQRECMFCHNGYPEVAEGSDQRGQPHLFPEDLPEGLGCQRCHGPGAEHVRVALGGISSNPHLTVQDAASTHDDDTRSDPTASTLEPVRASIVNPGRFSAERLNEVCFSCHMQPTVAIFGLRRFGRADYSYRVGEPLHEYFVNLDVDELDAPREERFEINHHPYRLQQSRCYLESPTEMTCLTCHDPHRKVAPAERAAHYRQVCQSCHQLDACSLDAMADDLPERLRPAVAANDCATCHMPRRSPTDVVQVVMTDHKIQRRPDVDAFLELRRESSPVLVGIELIGDHAPEGAEAEVYTAMAVERAGGQTEALEHLARHLPVSGIDDSEPWHQLLRGHLRLRRYDQAVALGTQLVQRYPDEPRLMELLSFSQLAVGRRADGLKTLRDAVALRPERPESRFNLGHVLSQGGQYDEAIVHLERAVAQRPNFVEAWSRLGTTYGLRAAQGDLDAARSALERALAIDPSHTKTYVALIDLLITVEDYGAADTWWLHGRGHAADPSALPQRSPRDQAGQAAD